MQILNDAQSRLTAMLVLTTIFFTVEIVVGYITNSMALIADSFHMFSDAIALVIAFISVRMSPKKWSKNTFGWARAEILGALVNAVFLCALCFSILIESIKRFMKPDLIHNPQLILFVGGLGLFINIIGLFLFKEGHHHHGHSHHGHHHHHHHHHHHLPSVEEDSYLVCEDEKNDKTSDKIKYGLLCHHKDHTNSHDLLCNTANHSQTPSPDNHDDNDEKHLTKTTNSQSDNKDSCDGEHAQTRGDHNHRSSIDDTGKKIEKKEDHTHSNVHLVFRQPNKKVDCDDSASGHRHVAINCGSEDKCQSKPKPQPTSSQMNMRGVFLHVMADALGSVTVMISALVVIYTEGPFRLYVDPLLSVLMVCLILKTTWPLLTESAMILLQTVPTHIQVDSLRRRLTQEIQGVLAVHEFHVWQLAGDRIIASAHIRCHNLQDYMRIAEKVKEFFHNEGIHSTTIQPEFTDIESGILDESNDNCVLDCPSTQRPHCAPSTCCQKTPSSIEPIVGAADCGGGGDDEEQCGTLLKRSNMKRSDSVEGSKSSEPHKDKSCRVGQSEAASSATTEGL